MTSPVFSLPAYRVGPYTLKACATPREGFHDKRRVLEHDWNTGECRIAEHLGTRRTIECLMRSMVTAIHYRSGLNDKSDEESYTHSLATGLVELAQNNPEFWGALQQVLEDDYKPGAGWGRTARGAPVAAALTPPKRIVFDHRSCTINWIENWRDTGAYGFYWLKQGKIDLQSNLRGTNLALVSLHEVLHFLHECVGLKNSTKETPFKRAQAYTLLRFIQQNPKFWAWWLHITRTAAVEPLLLAA